MKEIKVALLTILIERCKNDGLSLNASEIKALVFERNEEKTESAKKRYIEWQVLARISG